MDSDSKTYQKMLSRSPSFCSSSSDLKSYLRGVLRVILRMHESGDAHGNLNPQCFDWEPISGALHLVSFS
jgi:hypothetical protein